MLSAPKHADRFTSKDFLAYVREGACTVCLFLGLPCGVECQPSHMISVKWAAGSDALALRACQNHHPQSTAAARRVFTDLGIDLNAEHQKLWSGFLRYHGIVGVLVDILTQFEFEALCVEAGLGQYDDGSGRKNRKDWKEGHSR
jgi:hypothetical protein